MNTFTRPRQSAVTESLIFAGRIFSHWRRSPVVPIQSLLFPVVILVTYYLLISRSMARITGADKLDALVVICAIGGGMSGALGAAMALPEERRCGLLSRIWTLPVHRASPISGALIAEAARTFACTALTAAVGFMLGFRFTGPWYAMVAFALIPSLVVVVFTMVILALAVGSQNSNILSWLSMAALGMVFGSAVPADKAPSFARPLVQNQPMAVVIESMRSLASGEPDIIKLLVALGWIVVLGAISAPFALRRYRAAAESA